MVTSDSPLAKILLLEDDPILGEQICFTLKANGYDVDWSDNLEHCSDLLHGNTYDIAIFDVDVQGKNSIDFFVDQKTSERPYPPFFYRPTVAKKMWHEC